MTFIATIAPQEAEGEVAELYASERETFGHLPNLVQAFSHRPAVYAAWRALISAINGGMDLRRYELVTVAAARQLRSSYCTLAHGSILADRFLGQEQVRTLVADGSADGLDEVDVAVMELAAKVARDASAVTGDDIERLRSFGLSDGEIFDVVAAAAARCFFIKVLDGLGVAADARFAELDAGLREVLTVGRPIDGMPRSQA
jgi:uncharacterized peroxidase-related enzyme